MWDLVGNPRRPVFSQRGSYIVIPLTDEVKLMNQKMLVSLESQQEKLALHVTIFPYLSSLDLKRKVPQNMSYDFMDIHVHVHHLYSHVHVKLCSVYKLTNI